MTPRDALVAARAAITTVRACVADANPEGFNPLVGDWCERLFRSQSETLYAIKLIDAALTSQAGADGGEYAELCDALYCIGFGTTYEAAAAIEVLERERDEARAGYDKLLTTWAESRERHLAAEAEVAGMREALKEADWDIDGLAAFVTDRMNEAVGNDYTQGRHDAWEHALRMVNDASFARYRAARAALPARQGGGE